MFSNCLYSFSIIMSLVTIFVSHHVKMIFFWKITINIDGTGLNTSLAVFGGLIAKKEEKKHTWTSIVTLFGFIFWSKMVLRLNLTAEPSRGIGWLFFPLQKWLDGFFFGWRPSPTGSVSWGIPRVSNPQGWWDCCFFYLMRHSGEWTGIQPIFSPLAH